METLDLYLNLIRLVVDAILLVLGIIIVFGKTYINEKAKNLATKEDIATITKEVETVKNELSYKTQFKSTLHEETKVITIQTFEYLDILYETIIYPHYFWDIDSSALKEIEAQRKKAGDNYNRAFAKLSLYVGDTSMIMMFKDCAKIVGKLNSEYTAANFSKAQVVDIKNTNGEPDIDDYRSATADIDQYTRLKRIWDAGNKRMHDDAIKAGQTFNEYRPKWMESREKLRVCISAFITGG